MNDQDVQLHDRLAAISDDAPTEAAVLGTVRRGYHRRLRRRRWYATGSAAAVVLLVAGATSLVGADPFATPHEAASPTVTSTLGPRDNASTTALALHSQLTPFDSGEVTSPVYVPESWVSFDPNPPDVDSSPSTLRVGWIEHAPVRTGPVSFDVGTNRGYTITTTEPPLQVQDLGETIHLQRQDISVNGHPARLVTVPAGNMSENMTTHSISTDPQVIWQLSDGRWISVSSGGSTDPELIGFAAAIQEEATVFPADISIGMTLKGFTGVSSTSSTFVSQMSGPRLMLCRPAPAPEDGNCLTVAADVADGGFGAGIVMGNESNAQFLAHSIVIDVGGVHVNVNAEYQAAWTRWGKATILVQSPGGVTVSPADLAVLAASVRLAPTLQVKNQPNPLVESSLAEVSAAEATQSRATR